MAAMPPPSKCAAVATEEDDTFAIFMSILLPLGMWLCGLPPEIWTVEIAPKILGKKRDFCAFRATCREFRLLAGQRWFGDWVRTREWKASGRALTALGSWCGRLVTGHNDGTIRLWTPDFRPARKMLPGHGMKVNAFDEWQSLDIPIKAFVEWHGLLASCDWSNEIRLWGEAGKCVHVLKDHRDLVHCLVVWGNYLVSSSRDKTLRLWDFATFTSRVLFREVLGQAWCSQLVVLGDTLVGYTTDFRLLFWDAHCNLIFGLRMRYTMSDIVVWNDVLATAGNWGVVLFDTSGKMLRRVGSFGVCGDVETFAVLGQHLMITFSSYGVCSSCGYIGILDADYQMVLKDEICGGYATLLTTVGTSFVVSRGNRLFLYERRLFPSAFCFPL